MYNMEAFSVGVASYNPSLYSECLVNAEYLQREMPSWALEEDGISNTDASNADNSDTDDVGRAEVPQDGGHRSTSPRIEHRENIDDYPNPVYEDPEPFLGKFHRPKSANNSNYNTDG